MISMDLLANVSNFVMPFVGTTSNNFTFENTEQEFQLSAVERTALIVVNFALAVIGTLGNFLIIFAVLATPELRLKVSNFFLLSLAVADLFVTMIAQPLYAIAVNMMYFYRCSRYVRVMVTVLQIVGVLSVLSSVFHLASISIDRVVCTVKPCQYRFIKKRRSKVMLGACWSSAAVFCCFLYVSHIFTTELPHVFSITRLAVPLLSFALMLGSYSGIFYKIMFSRIPAHVPRESLSAVRIRLMENRVSKTIAIVVVLSFACWIPGVLHFLTQKQFNWCGLVIQTNQLWIFTIILSKSSVTFLVYIIRIRHFRVACRRVIMKTLRAFRQAITCCRWRHDTKQYKVTYNLEMITTDLVE